MFLHSELSMGCGYFFSSPSDLKLFRVCSPEFTQQWKSGCRFQGYEKEQNCLLWQKITSDDIPVKDIEKIVYSSGLRDLKALAARTASSNKFAKWLMDQKHKEDLDYLLVAKEIEEIREYMNNPWYYAYDGDEEHVRLNQLLTLCKQYDGQRHAARYGLQLMRLYFAQKDFQSCIDLWEESLSKLPQDIVTDISASYAGGAYRRKGDKDKAIELYNLCQDIGSLIQLDDWEARKENSKFADYRIKEMEYIFDRFPNSPLLAINLQEHIGAREQFVNNFKDWESRGFHDPVYVKTKWVGDSLVADDEKEFYDELKRFSKHVINSKDCEQKGMWNYGLAYLYYLDGDKKTATGYLKDALASDNPPFLSESIETFRILLDALEINNGKSYKNRLLADLKWLEQRMIEDIPERDFYKWQYENLYNYSFYYWQDVARKIFLGEVVPQLMESGNVVLALQLANYASNHIYQLSPLFETSYCALNEMGDHVLYTTIITFDDYRKNWNEFNQFDYCNQFFEAIDSVSAKDAEEYAERILNPRNELDKYLNERSYIDNDYIFDIVGTLYLREMNYDKAVEWLSKVTPAYQARTNLSKQGYFRHDPFKYQNGKKQFISDSNDYKLRFAQEMAQLGRLINSDAEPNRKANAKIRFAVGLRNSFGQCWYLTQYSYTSEDYYNSKCREGFDDNPYALEAYRKVDELTAQALTEFTDPEQAAFAQLEMNNFKTVVTLYPESEAAAFVRSRCDNYYDYAFQKL